jgi:hypothetical protein
MDANPAHPATPLAGDKADRKSIRCRHNIGIARSRFRVWMKHLEKPT